MCVCVFDLLYCNKLGPFVSFLLIVPTHMMHTLHCICAYSLCTVVPNCCTVRRRIVCYSRSFQIDRSAGHRSNFSMNSIKPNQHLNSTQQHDVDLFKMQKTSWRCLRRDVEVISKALAPGCQSIAGFQFFLGPTA